MAPKAHTERRRGCPPRVLSHPVAASFAVLVALVAATLTVPGVVAAAPLSLANTINTGATSANWSPDSPDPSGLAWVPSRGLFVVDGEVEESTGAGWNSVNAWFASTRGVTTAGFDFTSAPTNPANKEPVGAAYDAARNELYVSKDGSNGRVWVYNASTMTQLRTFAVSGAPYNNIDPEGLGFGSGVLYMVVAIHNDLVKVQPGGDGVAGTSDDVVSNYDLEQYGQFQPQGPGRPSGHRQYLDRQQPGSRCRPGPDDRGFADGSARLQSLPRRRQPSFGRRPGHRPAVGRKHRLGDLRRRPGRGQQRHPQ